MKKRVFAIAIFFIVVIAIITAIGCVIGYNNTSDAIKQEQLVKINEINQLINMGKIDEAKIGINEIDTYLRSTTNSFNPTFIILSGVASSVFIILVFIYIYFQILRPFDKLKNYLLL